MPRILMNLPATVALLATLCLTTFQASATELLGFNISSTYSVLGSINEPTAPIPLQVLLAGPTSEVTFVALSSSDRSVFDTFETMAILPGEASGIVRVSAFSLGSAELKAGLGSSLARANVTVVSQIPAVPEPSVLLMLTVGLAFIAGSAKRRSGKWGSDPYLPTRRSER